MTIRMKQYLISALIGLAALIVVFPSQAAINWHQPANVCSMID